MTSPNGERIALRMMAASVTERAIGPAVSWLCEIGMIPACDTSPTVGFSPTTELRAEGQTIDPSVSVPIAAAQRFAAGATPDPELDPHGSVPRSEGLRVTPPRALQPFTWTPASATALGWIPRKFAHSDRFALPMT